VLSHQGKREFASPVEPMTPEAFALNMIDDLDSKLAVLRGLAEWRLGLRLGEEPRPLRMAGESALRRQADAEPEGSTTTAPPRRSGRSEVHLVEHPVDRTPVTET